MFGMNQTPRAGESLGVLGVLIVRIVMLNNSASNIIGLSDVNMLVGIDDDVDVKRHLE